MEPPADQPPRGSKRPLGGGDLDKASGARRYGDYGAACDFVDDDEEGSGGGGDSSRDDTGFLDENGSIVERAARGATKEDAWLGTADADTAPAPAATKRARKALRKQEEDERLVDDLVSSRAVFEIKKRMAGLLEPGETVPRALRRLKGGGASANGGTRGTASRMDEATRRAFDELTDAAAELVERGDLDAYTDDREAFERAAWVYEYRRRARASASAAAPEEVEEEYQADRTGSTCTNYVDRFGDAGGQAVDNPDQPAALPDASGPAAATEGEEAGEGEGTGVAGWDYVYDPASGYYYSGSTGYYYDAASGCYCSASTGTWFSYDGDDGHQYSGTPKEM